MRGGSEAFLEQVVRVREVLLRGAEVSAEGCVYMKECVFQCVRAQESIHVVSGIAAENHCNDEERGKDDGEDHVRPPRPSLRSERVIVVRLFVHFVY